MTPKPMTPKFAEGEKVLCFHGPLIYEAKCLKSSITKEKHVKYLIHYAGWNKNWDEWVPESRVLKFNEANVQRQKDVQKAHALQPTKTKKSTAKSRKSDAGSSAVNKQTEQTAVTKEKDTELRSSSPHVDTVSQDSGSDQPRKKRSRVEVSVESEEQFLNKVEVKIKIPEELQSWLVNDWEIIMTQQKLVKLPAKLTVNKILDNYLAYKKSSKVNNQQKESVIKDITNGIKEYFNATLGSQLLYKAERQQYNEILQSYPDMPMSKIYGAIHLLRLFVKMGPMLAYTILDEKGVAHVLTHIRDFLKYMASNKTGFFSVLDYKNGAPQTNMSDDT